jgi:hypothetical protein
VQLQDQHKRLHTHPKVIEVLELGLKTWMGVNCPSIELLNWPDEVWHLWEHQQEIGWEHIFQGQFLTKWMELQHQHLHKKGLLH